MKEEREEEFIYAGIPTYMGGEFIREKEIKDYDVVFLGIPCDYGASYRLGAKYAPRQLREYSFWDRIYGEELYDLDHNEYLKTNELKIADLGDVYVNPTNPEENQNAIAGVYNICLANRCNRICKRRGCNIPVLNRADMVIGHGAEFNCVGKTEK